MKRRLEIAEGRIRVNGLDIELIPVDHSIPGACGMLVYGSEKTVAYSGDIRMHGTHGHLTQGFAERLSAEKPDVFICEGTRIAEKDIHSESHVKANCSETIRNSKGLVMADFAFKDTARFRTFLEAAKESGRRLCIPFKDAYYIRALKPLIPELPDLKDESILLYKERKGSGTFGERDYIGWEREFLDKDNAVTAEEISKMQESVIMALGYYDLTELIDLKPKAGSIYIKSASEAFNEEQRFDLERLKRWLGHFSMGYANFHASGHAPGQDIARVVGIANAKTLVPVHTERPEVFAQITKAASIELPVLAKGSGL